MISSSVATSWRCPHCGQLQAGALRCWRCERAGDSCSTCHRCRRAVASDLGYCADDRGRTPVSGDEVRPCWEAAAAVPSASGLFAELDVAAVGPVLTPPVIAATPPPPLRRSAKAAKPPLEEPRAAAWTEMPVGELTDAPHVAPEPRPKPDAERRRRWGLR